MGGQIGIVVEELIGQQQVVIKSLGERFKKLRGIAGAAILGDGKVGLILEMSGLAAVHNARGATARLPGSSRSAEQTDGESSVTESEFASDTASDDKEVLVPA